MDLAGALDQAHYCIKCHNQGKDSCSTGLKEKDGRIQEDRLRSHAGGLPAGRKDLRDERGEAAGQHRRRAGDRDHRQSDGGRHRPSHLQRLHEVLHFPEAGPGGHPAGGNAHAERRAGAALGLRDLQPADALESAELRASAAARAQRVQSAGGGAGPGRLHAGALPDERRPHRGGRSTG